MNDLDRLLLRSNLMFTISMPHGRVPAQMRRSLVQVVEITASGGPVRKTGSGKGPATSCAVSRSFTYITF
jgi:hypothetical protein